MNDNFTLTDTHTHIYYKSGEELHNQIKRCKNKSIERLFLPNVDAKSIDLVVDTVRAHPQNCFAMLGLHPCSVNEDYVNELKHIESAITKHQIYAIGEIGIDLYWDKTTLAIQQDAFRIQINWAKQLGLPIDIHCRDAFDEVFEVLEDMNDNKLFGIFHCFTGNLQQAQRAINLGFKLGIGGVVTFKKAGLDDVVRQISLEHIVLETDAPYLAPSPFRGKENESSYLFYVAEKVAELHQVPIKTVADITTENSKQIFKI